MPFLVKVAEGDDPRELAENLSDNDAKELAIRVHAATGEIVTLIPYMHKGGRYVLDEDGAILVGVEPEPEVVEEPKKAAPAKAAKKSKKAAK
jgi:hypothetical protein